MANKFSLLIYIAGMGRNYPFILCFNIRHLSRSKAHFLKTYSVALILEAGFLLRGFGVCPGNGLRRSGSGACIEIHFGNAAILLAVQFEVLTPVKAEKPGNQVAGELEDVIILIAGRPVVVAAGGLDCDLSFPTASGCF